MGIQQYFVTLQKNVRNMTTGRDEIIKQIRQVGKMTLPEGASLYLYGSRARGDNRPDSDWDIMIMLDKEKLNGDDFGYGYPFHELGWEIDEEINPTICAKGHWNRHSFLPFFKNVEKDKIVLL